MDPQPTLKPSQSATNQVTPPPTEVEVKSKVKKASLQLALITLIFVIVAASGYFFLQNQSPTPLVQVPPQQADGGPPSIAPESTTDWPTYSNDRYKYFFQCSPTSQHQIVITSQDGITKPYSQETCSSGQNQITISVLKKTPYQEVTEKNISQRLSGESLTPQGFKSLSVSEFPALQYDATNINGQNEARYIEIDTGNYLIQLRGFDTTYFDQILSTFKFINPSPSPKAPTKSPSQPPPKATLTPTTPPNYNSLLEITPTSIDYSPKPTEIKQIPITITNHSNTNVSWSVTRTSCSVTGNCPINLTNGFTAPGGTLTPNATTQTIVALASTLEKPEVTANLQFRFTNADSGSDLITKDLLVTTANQINPDTTIETNSSVNPVLNITFSPNSTYPIILKNTHDLNLSWTSTIPTPNVSGKINYGSSSGWFRPGESWHTDLQLNNSYDGPSTFFVVYTFTDSQNQTIATKTLTVNITP